MLHMFFYFFYIHTFLVSSLALDVGVPPRFLWFLDVFMFFTKMFLGVWPFDFRCSDLPKNPEFSGFKGCRQAKRKVVATRVNAEGLQLDLTPPPGKSAPADISQIDPDPFF